MKTCIYLRNRQDDLTFNSAEHIIPAGIGGMKKLQKGLVSDQANQKFSSLELDFTRNSIVSLPRQFYGPGKRGALSADKASKSNIHVVYVAGETNDPSLGYIKLGKPYQIPQIRVKSDSMFTMIFDAGDGDSQGQYEKFINDLKSFDGKFVHIKEKELNSNEILIGYFDSNWFVASKGDVDSAVVSETVSRITNGKLEVVGLPKQGSHQVRSSQTMAFNIEYFLRVNAKIAFNFLADVEGVAFVLQDRFNPIRDWIIDGGENKYATIVTQDIHKTFEHLQFPTDSHKIIISKVGSRLVGFVGLYGDHFCTAIQLCDDFKGLYSVKGFICDWQIKKEYSLLDFLNLTHGK